MLRVAAMGTEAFVRVGCRGAGRVVDGASGRTRHARSLLKGGRTPLGVLTEDQSGVCLPVLTHLPAARSRQCWAAGIGRARARARAPPQLGFFAGIWGVNGEDWGAPPLFHPPRQKSTGAPPNQRKRQVPGQAGQCPGAEWAAGRADTAWTPVAPPVLPSSPAAQAIGQ